MVSSTELAREIQLTYYARRTRGASIMPKIPEISVEIQMERSVSVIPTGIFGITRGGGPLVSVGIFRSKFDKPVLCPN